MEELENAEHGQGDPTISLGLDDAGDQDLTTWNGSILGLGGNFENRFISLHIVAGPNYPAEPPEIKFVSKVKISNPGNFVDGTGNVNMQAAGWNSNKTLKEMLIAIKGVLNSNKSVAQPADGSTF